MKELDNTTKKIIKENPNILDWNVLCKTHIIPYNIIEQNLSKISIRLLLTYQELPEQFIERYIYRKDLIPVICQNQKLSTRLMFKYADILDWGIMSFYQDIPEGLIRKMIDKVDINEIILRQKISNKFLEDYKDRINWNYINSIYCKISNL